MIKRVVEISSGPTNLTLRHSQLILSRDGEEIGQVPIEDLGVLVVDDRSVTYTNALLCALLANNVSVVVCGENHVPAGLFLPMEGNTVQAAVFALQVEAMPRLKKRLWKEIVAEKIRNQADVLRQGNREGAVLVEMAKRVAAGDPENMEARAAVVYWQRLFGGDFCRDRYGYPPNNFLNYGYAVLRAAVVRAVVSSGLHPSLGIHHCNKYNAFALADDLMEPVRPMVDSIVYQMWKEGKSELTKEEKARLLGVLSSPVDWQGQNFPLMVALHHYMASLKRALAGEEKGLYFPRLVFY